MMMPQIPNQLQLAHHDDEGVREEELNENIDDAVAHYPSMMWGQQPVIYPMMMMMPMSPLGQNGESDQQRMMQFNPPDVVDGRNSSFSNMNNEVISRDIDHQRR